MTVSLVRTKTEYVFAVSGEQPLDIAFNPDNGKFLPDTLWVIVEGDDVEVRVIGPVLRSGRPLKTKQSSLRWRRDDLYGPQALEDVPEWVVAVVNGVMLRQLL